MSRIFVALVLSCVLAAPATAREFPHFFQGVRPLGMGGAFTAVADDENALFFNPAGLAKVDQWSMGLINPLLESSESNSDLYKDVDDTDLDATSEVADLIRDNLGETAHFRLALFPHVVTPNFAIGVLGQVQANLEARNVANPEMDVDALGTASGHLGYGHGFFNDILRVGAGAKYISASRLREVYTAADISADDFDTRVEDDMMDGDGFGFDVGVMVTAPVLLKPTLGVVVLNVGDVDLGDAGVLPQQLNVGVSLAHDFSWVKITGAADILDITKDAGFDEDMNKRLHMGLEAKTKYLALRTGLYQGYGSFGATIDLRLLKLDYANYAEEISSFAGGKPDRRHVAQVTIGW